MDVRRALLLFAIVLVLAAIASSIASQPQPGGDETVATAPAPAPSAAPGEPTIAPAPATVTFPAGGEPQTRRIESGQAATVLVEVQAAGQVQIPSLGLDGSAEPLTPARFDVLVAEPGKHQIVVSPASGAPPSERVGTLRVVAPS